MMKKILILLVFWSFTNPILAKDIFVGGANASDSNPGTSAQPYATIQKAATSAVSGDVVIVRDGVYRETIVPAANGVTFRAEGTNAVVSGLELAGNTGWTVHSGNIYKKTITLPAANNFNNSTGGSNTTLLANQVFKDGKMMMLARYPKVSAPEEMMDKTKMRTAANTSSWDNNQVTDAGLGAFASGSLTGGQIFINGWFLSETRPINGNSGNTVRYNSGTLDGGAWRKFYYITNALSLLTQAKEWHYQSNTLYFWQEGGGSPTGVEFKARNWAFDLKNRSNIQIIGLQFLGCEPITTNGSTTNCTLDNITALHPNHAFINPESSPEYFFNARQVGIRLTGAGNVIKNSTFKCGIQAIWAGSNSRIENNYFSDFGYDGGYGAPISFIEGCNGVVITKNTMVRTGRSSIHLGATVRGNQTPANYSNIDISYNDMSYHSMLSIDNGAIYSNVHTRLNGTRIHHNWMHHNAISRVGGVDGVQVTGVYLDQMSGPVTIDHNVTWAGDECDFYAEQKEGTTEVNHQHYNNTWAGTTDRSYIVYATPSRPDVQRNNIYRGNISGGGLDIQFCSMNNVNPQFVGGDINTLKGLYYKPTATSPGRDAGTAIAGITDGFVGTKPDIGAYEYGGEDWVAGFKPVPLTSAPNTPPTVSITAPANNATVVQGTTVSITATAADNGSVTKVEFFDGTTKIGEDLTSPYKFDWAKPSVGTHSITAKATDNSNASGVSAAITINVTAAANVAPTVNITSPATNSSATVGVGLTINATAADADGVAKVEFFAGATKVGEDTSSPYSLSWTPSKAGAYNITAKATDSKGASTTSSIVIVNAVDKAVPKVVITAPSNNANIAAGKSVTITATASVTSGQITKVEFFNGQTKLGEDASSPYSFVWNSLAAGTYNLTAKATDNTNTVATSTSVAIVVVAPGVEPAMTIAITDPLNGASFTEGTEVNVEAEIGNDNGKIAKVEFFAGSVKIGEDTQAPYASVWTAKTLGDSKLTAQLTDDKNAVIRSEEIVVSVVKAGEPTAPGEQPTTPGQPAVAEGSIPRFFSPNADGVNDTWTWTDPTLAQGASVSVFNRQGQKVYEAAPYNNSWDGTTSNNSLADGDYYYIVRAENGTEMRGALRIIR